MAEVMAGVALTGGHARSIEKFLEELNAVSEVLASLRISLAEAYGGPAVYRWFAASVLGTPFLTGDVKRDRAFDRARRIGLVTNAPFGTAEVLTGKVVPQVSLLRVSDIADTSVRTLVDILLSNKRLLSYQSDPILRNCLWRCCRSSCCWRPSL
jgi:hypothetical protein